VEPVILGSARKHGVSDEDILHALANPSTVTEMDEGFTMIAGGDRAGNLIEVGVVAADSREGLLLIVHAMRPARTTFLDVRPKRRP
jgi:hypothetical protein